MTDINTLLKLNVELEGLLKVLLDRDSIHARSLLAEKFREYADGLQNYLSEAAPSQAETEAVVSLGEEVAAEAQATELKDQEAEDAQVTDETEAATEAIEQAPESTNHTETPRENGKLLKTFTLNDKFRFRRELFNGDDEDFADTLSLLAHMPSYDEAVDYLTNDLLWDARNPAVEDFFAILKDNMPS